MGFRVCERFNRPVVVTSAVDRAIAQENDLIRVNYGLAAVAIVVQPGYKWASAYEPSATGGLPSISAGCEDFLFYKWASE